MTALPPGQVGELSADSAVPLSVTGFGGAAISVRVRRGSRGVPVLLVHGFGSSGEANWSATGWLGGLERAGLTTVVVDLRGHGSSAKPHEGAAYSLPIMLADLRLVLAALPSVLGMLPAVDLVGYSMGGRMVGELAAAATGAPAYPERAPWEAGLPEIRRAVIGGYDGRPLFSGTDVTEFRRALAGMPGPDSPGRRIASIALATGGNDLAALSALVEGLSADPRPLPAQAVEVPTLVVAGERDAITDGTLRWAAGLPQGRHLVLAGRHHISAITSAVFRSAAAEFLTG